MNSREFYNLCLSTMDGIDAYGPLSVQFLIEIAQNALLSTPAEQNINFSAATGRMVTFNTQAGQFEYNAPADCWRVAWILIEVDQPNSILDQFFYNYDYNSIRTRSGGNKLEMVRVSGVSYYIIPFIRTFDATETVRARILFTEDPGATTGVYRIWYYPRPTRHLSDSSPLLIGPPWDLIYLYPSVRALYQGLKDGNMEEAIGKVMMYRNKYTNELNKGAQDTDLESVERF